MLCCWLLNETKPLIDSNMLDPQDKKTLALPETKNYKTGKCMSRVCSTSLNHHFHRLIVTIQSYQLAPYNKSGMAVLEIHLKTV